LASQTDAYQRETMTEEKERQKESGCGNGTFADAFADGSNTEELIFRIIVTVIVIVKLFLEFRIIRISLVIVIVTNVKPL